MKNFSWPKVICPPRMYCWMKSPHNIFAELLNMIKFPGSRNSFLDIGVLPIGTIFLYQLRESQGEGCRFKFGVIDGAHRVIALKRLREAYPTIMLPISFPARIYKDIELSDINIFSSILNGRKICYKELQELEE